MIVTLQLLLALIPQDLVLARQALEEYDQDNQDKISVLSHDLISKDRTINAHISTISNLRGLAQSRHDEIARLSDQLRELRAREPAITQEQIDGLKQSLYEASDTIKLAREQFGTVFSYNHITCQLFTWEVTAIKKAFDKGLIMAIKELRKATHMGLKDAKDLLELHPEFQPFADKARKRIAASV